MFSYGLGAEMLNFGALIAFMGVNAAAIVHYYIRQQDRKLFSLLPPAAGFLICLGLWLGLSKPAKIAGVIWMAAGIAFGAFKTKGFRRSLIDFNLPAE
jgi:putrescine importer